MLSTSNTSKSQYNNYVMGVDMNTARKRVIERLNQNKGQHPPEIYYIRRNIKKLDYYLEPNNFNELMKDKRKIPK